jgi:hypothetical protein
MAQNILSDIGSLVFRFYRKRPLAIVKNEDTDHTFTQNEIRQLGNLTLPDLQNITTGVFELGGPYNPTGFLPVAGVGGVCAEVGPWSQLSRQNNCLDCVKKNFLDCVFDRGTPERQLRYRTLLGAGDQTGVNVQRPSDNEILIDCPGWRNIPDLVNIRDQVYAVENLPDNPWIVDCHFHVFFPVSVGNVEVGQSNKVELTFRFKRDTEEMRLREMGERREIKAAGKSKGKDDTGSGSVKGRGRFDFINDDATYVPHAKRKQYPPRRGNKSRWGKGGKKTRKNKSRKSMKKKSRKSRKSMKKKSRNQ